MNSGLWWLVQHLVSVTVLALFVWLVCFALRNRPAWRHALWLVVLIKFVTPPIVSWPWSVSEIADRYKPVTHEVAVSLPDSNAPFVEEPVELVAKTDLSVPAEIPVWDDSPPEPSIVFDDSARHTPEVVPTPNERSEVLTDRRIRSLQMLLFALWIGGAAIALATQLLRIRRQTRFVSRGVFAPQTLVEEVEKISNQLKVRTISATVVPSIAAPFLWCLGRLRLIWPEALTSDRELSRARGIIAHELAHVQRRDHWVAWLELVAGVIWWWNPLYWFVRHRLRESAEMSCDAIALSVVEDRREYAELFLELSTNYKSGVPAPVLGVDTGTPSSFERRLAMIFSDRVSSKLSVWGILLVGCLAAIALPNLMFAQVNPESGDPAQNTSELNDSPQTENPPGVPFLEQLPLIGDQFRNHPIEEANRATPKTDPARPSSFGAQFFNSQVQPLEATSLQPTLRDSRDSNAALNDSGNATSAADPTATPSLRAKTLRGEWRGHRVQIQ